ncbi:MAG: putative toxin-antitoxin system toxin component, PIN family [Chloroherpetonaceae bacterium]|nr:putative toxin-antitoxin system toxin component, PIN family [Chloroherpetonaceae bacterium]
MLFVFDTNTLVSAIIKTESVPAQALDKAKKLGTIIFSEITKEEYLLAIQREKFNKYLPLTERLSRANQLIESSEIINIKTTLVNVCRDINDIKFLNLAIECKASCIVSGDKDLLVLNPFQKIPIIKPSEFINEFPMYLC